MTAGDEPPVGNQTPPRIGVGGRPSVEHAAGVYGDRIRAARRMTVEQRLCATAELFDELCERMRDGIRWQFPDARPEVVERIRRQHLEIARTLEQSLVRPGPKGESPDDSDK